MSARLALLFGAVLLCGGCTVPSDVGKPCVLVKKNASGDGAVPATTNEVKYDQDFISFGSVECEDLVCVRSANTRIETSGTGESVTVLGYCSKPCNLNTADCNSTHPDTTQEIKAGMGCRALLLDQQTLSALKLADPAAYEAIFGKNESPNYCASSTRQ
jgi:hypothetical protein